MSVLLECVECGAIENEFPSADYKPDEPLIFTCPACGFEDSLMPQDSVASYAKEFSLKVKEQ